MSEIKKVNIEKMTENIFPKKTISNKLDSKIEILNISTMNNEIQYKKEIEAIQEEEKNIEHPVAKEYLNKVIERPIMNNRPKTIEEWKITIDQIKNTNQSTGNKLANIAMLTALPYVKMTDGEGKEWAKVFEKQTGPYTESFNSLHDIAINTIRTDGTKVGNFGWGSCTHSVATIVIPTYDPDFPCDGGTTKQLEYLQRHPEKWEYNGMVKAGEKWEGIQTGDILISELKNNRQHIMMCTNTYNNSIELYEGAANSNGYSMYPILTKEQNNIDSIGRTYYISRPAK